MTHSGKSWIAGGTVLLLSAVLIIAGHKMRAASDASVAQYDDIITAFRSATETGSPAPAGPQYCGPNPSRPLDPSPYLACSLSALSTGDQDRALSLADATLMRNPREREAMRVKLRIALTRTDYPAAIDALDYFFRTNPSSRPRYVDILKMLSNDTRAYDAIDSALTQNPIWALDFLDAMIAEGLYTPFVTQIVNSWAQANPDASRRRSVEETLIARLLDEQDITTAKRYQRLLSRSADAPETIIFDPAFEGLDGPRPLNWRLPPPRQNYAEFIPGGGLRIGYTGRAVSQFATQTFWPPAAQDFMLSSTISGQSRANTGHLEWRLQCRQTRRRIATMPMKTVTETPTTISMPVTAQMIGGCDTLSLSLFGVAGARAGHSRFTLKNVMLRTTTEAPNE